MSAARQARVLAADRGRGGVLGRCWSRSSNAASHGSFLEPSNIVRVLRQITYNCILGVGQTFVIITAGIDLSVGSLVALTGVVAALFANSVHLSGFPLIAATLIVAVGVGGAAGWVNALPSSSSTFRPSSRRWRCSRWRSAPRSFFRTAARSRCRSTRLSKHRHRLVSRRRYHALHLPSIPVPVIWMLVVIVPLRCF